MMPTTSWSVWRSCLLPGTTGTSHTLLAWLSVRENWNMRTFIIRSKYLYPQTTWNSARIFSPSLFFPPSPPPSLPPSPSCSPLPLSPFPPPSLPLFLPPFLPFLPPHPPSLLTDNHIMQDERDYEGDISSDISRVSSFTRRHSHVHMVRQTFKTSRC